MTEVEKRIMAEAHLMLIPQNIRPFDEPECLPENSKFIMSSGGIARTLGGRLWIMWAGGGDSEKAFLLFSYSDDNGESFKSPQFLLHGPMTPGGLHTCIIEGNLFCAPDGKLHVFYCQRLGCMDGRMGAWHAVCENPDAENPEFSTPERIADGSLLDKPIILADGRWLLEISIWKKEYILLAEGAENCQNKCSIWKGKLSAPYGANFYISADQGKTWEYQGTAEADYPECDEPRIIQRRDGSLVMLLRNEKGLAWMTSDDLGKTWSKCVPAEFPHPTSRTCLDWLPDGRLMLIRNVPCEETIKTWKPDRDWTTGRENLTVFLSEDEGKTWSDGVLIDGRCDVSYPDCTITQDGTIHLLYDWKRKEGELMYARFSVADIDAGGPICPKVIFSAK